MILDASVVIGLLDPSDAHHRRAVALVVDAAEEARRMPLVTMAESLVRHTRAGRGRQAAARLTELGIIGDADVGDAPYLARVRSETGLRMPDCLVLAAAERAGERLATFDDQLARVAAGRGVVVLTGGT